MKSHLRFPKRADETSCNQVSPIACFSYASWIVHGERNDSFESCGGKKTLVRSLGMMVVLSQSTMKWKPPRRSMLVRHRCSPEILLDSTNIINEASQEQLLTIEPGMLHGEIASSDNITVSTTVGSNAQSSSLPACETWAGRYNFNVSFSAQNKSTKGVAWTYSPIKDKLYVGKDAPCPINFSANTVLPSDVYIRVMALYTSPEQVSEIVQRCVNHSMEEIKNGRVEAQHLIRCESSTATYHTDAAGRHSVLVPFENPPAGQMYSTYIYKFACFGSCAGGPNRRPLMLIFTLESGGQVIGRRKLDVKICACPGRDRKNEETQCAPAEAVNTPIHSPNKRKLPSECVALSEVMAFTKTIYAPLPKKKKTMPNKDGLYNLSTDDKDMYDFLRQMKKFYEMCKTIKNISPDILNMALQQLQKVKTERKD